MGPDYGACGSELGQACTVPPSGCVCQADEKWGPDYGACGSLVGQSCVFSCSGTELVNNLSTDYDCQLSEGSQGYDCNDGWTRSRRTPNACQRAGTVCCYRDTPVPTPVGCRCINSVYGPDYGACGSLLGQQCGGEATCHCSNGTYGPDYASCGSQYGLSCDSGTAPTTPPAAGDPAGQCPSMSCSYSEIQDGSTVCYSGTGATGFNQPGCTYVGGCSTQVSCPSSAPPPGGTAPTSPPAGGQPPPGGTAPTAVPIAVPTALPGQPENCDPSKVNMSVFPTNPSVGSQVTFSLSGTQGATHVGDSWSGGVNCSGGFAGNKTCTATAEGTFTWTHTWRNCLGSLSNCSSTTCTTSPKSFTIGSTTPTTPPIVTQPPPVAGDTQLVFNLTLSGIQAGRSLVTSVRNIQVELFNDAGNLVNTKVVSNILQYASSTGKFTATVNMGAVSGGNYTVKVKTDRYLKKRTPGIVVVPKDGATITIPETTLIVGDTSGDNKVDIQDYNIIIGCFGDKASTASCTNKTLADLDDNGSVDEVDYNVFVRSLAIQTGD